MKVFISEMAMQSTTEVEIHCRQADEKVRRLEHYISAYEERIAGWDEQGKQYVSPREILYFETVDGRTFLYTKQQVLEVEMKLYELEEYLDPQEFFRCGKSLVVNVGQIVRLKPEITRNILATMSNGEVLSISRRYVKAFRELLQK